MTWESLAERRAPSWSEDAKLGIMIQWGPYAAADRIPGAEEPRRVVAEHWGRRGHYDSLVRTFRQELREWDPADTLGAVAASGARYLIVSAKHCDGFALWPARTKNPRKGGWQAARDVVGELAEGARALGLKFGVYYSAGLDGTFGSNLAGGPIDQAIPRTRSYAAYVDAHWRELISRYSPSILWNDVGSPASEDLLSLLSDFYDAVPDGLVNDRFGQPESKEGGDRFIWSALRRLFPPRAARLPESDGAAPPARHSDFRTIESGGEYPDGEGPWECVRSLDDTEMDGAALTGSALVRQLCDVTARGGRLLLRLVPKADGSPGPFQARSLSKLGEWLKLNGEAIFGTRPWGEREGATEDGVEVRFTAKAMTAYAILMGTPPGRSIVLPSVKLQPYAGLRVLGSVGHTAWFQEGRDLHIRLTEPLREAPAHVITMTPQPRA